jgi:hypothetical protein
MQLNAIYLTKRHDDKCHLMKSHFTQCQADKKPFNEKSFYAMPG